MAKTKITQNINKDVGLLDLPKVKPQRSQWENKHSNYITSNIGDIVPVYAEVVMPNSKKRITMGMLSHMTTPIAPIFNAQYTEFRCFFVPHRLSADLLGGYKTRKSPWVKVFGEDPASSSAQIVVPLANQKLPNVSSGFISDFNAIFTSDSQNAFGGILDALDYESPTNGDDLPVIDASKFNFLSLAAYELIYQKAYRNQNRESATESDLYKFLFDGYNRSSVGSTVYSVVDKFHKAQREKDYFTGASPFTQKGDPISAPLVGESEVLIKNTGSSTLAANTRIDDLKVSTGGIAAGKSSNNYLLEDTTPNVVNAKLVVDLSSASGVNIEQLRLMIKTQELLEKDMMYGSDYASSLNAHFGTAPISLILDEPWEIKKVTITSQMQAIFQTSTTANEQTILGTIGANATTQSGEFEILPLTEFKEWGYLMICAVHKAQNAYDALLYKNRYLFKKARFEHYTPELDDLGYQDVSGLEFNYNQNGSSAVGFNEAFAEDRFVFNKCHGMFEPSRSGALDYWVLCCSNYNDIQSLYKQTETELDRAISIKSNTDPQFFDAYGFVEYNDKPMKLHSIPGFDGVI